MLVLEHISKGFDGRQVLHDVSVTVPTGATHALIMPAKHDEDFCRQRDETFSKITTLLDGRIRAITPVVVLRPQEMSPDNLRANAEKEVWSLFRNGIRHLKDGAPDGQPGAMAEALSRTSLRASPLAAALG